MIIKIIRNLLLHLYNSYKRKGFLNFLSEINFIIKNRISLLLHRKLNTLPVFYNIGISSVCNLHCKFCNQASYKQKGFTALEKIQKISNQIPKFSDITIVDLGESFLHKDIDMILQIFKKRQNRITLFTNGSFLPSNLEGILSSCNKLVISIDSVDEEKVKFLRRNSSLKQMKKVLIKISQVKREKKIRNCELVFNITISLYNYYEIKNILYFLKEVGFERAVFNLIEDWDFKGKEREKVFQKKDEIVAILQKSVQYCRENDLIISNFFDCNEANKLFKKKEHYSQCRWVEDCLVINWKGDLVPCCLRRDYRIFSLGNVYKSSLQTVLSSPKVEHFKKTKQQQFICKNCNWYF